MDKRQIIMDTVNEMYHLYEQENDIFMTRLLDAFLPNLVYAPYNHNRVDLALEGVIILMAQLEAVKQVRRGHYVWTLKHQQRAQA